MPAATDFKNSVKLYIRLLVYLNDRRGLGFLALVCMVLSAGSTAFVMNQLKPIINSTFLKTDDPRNFLPFSFIYIPITFAAALIKALSGYRQDYLNRYLGQRVVQRLRNDLYSHFLKLPMTYFNAQRTGGLASRITSDVQVLQDSMINVVGDGINSALMVMALAGRDGYQDWQLALLAFVVFPVALYPIFRYGRKIRQASREGQDILSDLNAQIHETLAGIRVVKAFGMEQFGTAEKFRNTNGQISSASPCRAQPGLCGLFPAGGNHRNVRHFTINPLDGLGTGALFLGTLTVGGFISFLAAALTMNPNLKTFA